MMGSALYHPKKGANVLYIKSVLKYVLFLIVTLYGTTRAVLSLSLKDKIPRCRGKRNHWLYRTGTVQVLSVFMMQLD